ncbi:hypothetical protein Ahy_B02g061313 isoform B [Arachis hypogaea]|uniref:Aminotransferase-like plant mobile domain-containing protein n=1 Tax=Arachis hypogaea TaxID=3818 RepID=A0A445AKL1_ARAHY|nr:hypothetical protein Ahy_B02g061313 isoform B [Arachis hypogaea]
MIGSFRTYRWPVYPSSKTEQDLVSIRRAIVEHIHGEMVTGDAYFSHAVRRCTITLQDVVYQLGLSIDSQYVSGCLTDFEQHIEVSFRGADDEMVRRHVRAYIMILLSTQLFRDKSGTHLHIRWLPYIARLEDMGQYGWGSATLSWLYRCMCRVANRNVVKLVGPL